MNKQNEEDILQSILKTALRKKEIISCSSTLQYYCVIMLINLIKVRTEKD